MTFFEWIRKCLQWDAKQHPMPKETGRSIKKRCERQSGIPNEKPFSVEKSKEIM